jgi:hypothetical protein
MSHPIDADPFIPTGIDASPDRVAELLADDVISVETLTVLPDAQYPSKEQIESAAEKSAKPTAEVLARLADVVGKETTKAALTAKLASLEGG